MTWWDRIKSLLRSGFCLIAAVGMVTRLPMMAVGFMVVKSTSMIKNDYMKILVAAGVSVLAMALILNFAELAVVGTAMGISEALGQWIEYVETA